jgi:hypothetical protein
MSEESADMVAFGSAELGAYTQRLIADMDRLGTKVRRDEWQFGEMDGKLLGIRINYAHREQRIHLLHGREEIDLVSVNIDSTGPEFPTLDSLLDRLRNQVAHTRVHGAVHRSGEEPK